MTRPQSDSTPTGTPTPVPTATLFWDGCAGPDDGSTGVGVGVDVRVVVTAGSGRLGDIGEATELGDVTVCEEGVASVDGFGSVVLTTVSAFAKTPKSGAKSVVSQHPASTTFGPTSDAPQHQCFEREPLLGGQAYRLLKLLTAAVIALARSEVELTSFLGLGRSRTVSASWTAVRRLPSDVRTPASIHISSRSEAVAIDRAWIPRTATGAVFTACCVTHVVGILRYGLVRIVTDCTCICKEDLVADV